MMRSTSTFEGGEAEMRGNAAAMIATRSPPIVVPKNRPLQGALRRYYNRQP
jgi:hypothetical protein